MTYIHIFVLNLNPNELEHVEFKWQSSELLHNKIQIKQLELQPLTAKDGENLMDQIIFTSNQKEIKSGEYIKFNKSS